MPAPTEPRPELLFVYAVNSGRVAMAIDYVHKLVSPATYPCSLCAVTYGPLGEREGWASGLAQLGTRNRFLHRDEFEREHGRGAGQLPAVFLVQNGRLEPLLDKAAIDACKSVPDLLGALRERLAKVSGESDARDRDAKIRGVR